MGDQEPKGARASGEEETLPTTEQEVLLDFARINPETAKKIRQRVDIPALLALLPTRQKDRYQRLSDAIDEYENAANDVVKGLKRNDLIVDVVFVGITVVLIMVSTIFADTAGVASTAGVGGVTFFAQAKTIADHLKLYNQEATKIKISVRHLKSALKRCERNDNACLDSVDALIKKAWDTLGGG